jgi:putative peptidoglycan lipid II flippase
VAIVAMAVNLVANLMLIWRFAHVGLALSTSLAAWINAAILYTILHRRGHFAIDARLRRVLPRAVAASALMGGLLWLAGPARARIPVQGFVERGMVLALLVGAGAAIYFIAAFLLRAIDPAELRDQLLRRAG